MKYHNAADYEFFGGNATLSDRKLFKEKLATITGDYELDHRRVDHEITCRQGTWGDTLYHCFRHKLTNKIICFGVCCSGEFMPSAFESRACKECHSMHRSWSFDICGKCQMRVNLGVGGGAIPGLEWAPTGQRFIRKDNLDGLIKYLKDVENIEATPADLELYDIDYHKNYYDLNREAEGYRKKH